MTNRKFNNIMSFVNITLGVFNLCIDNLIVGVIGIVCGVVLYKGK